MSTPSRTTTDRVAKVMRGGNPGSDYDGVSDLTPCVQTASAIVDRVVTAATVKGFTHSAVELELIERWLAAYVHTKTNKVYSSRSTGGASGSFAMGKNDPEPYRAMAVELDQSGCVNAALNQLRAGVFWVGKAASAQVPWDQRN